MKIAARKIGFLLLLGVCSLQPVTVHAATDANLQGASPPAPVTIANVGGPGTSFTVSSIALDDATHFSLVTGGTCAAPPFALDAGDSCTQFVVFDPQAVGPLSANLLVTSDAGEVLNDNVVLSGNGTPGPQAQLTIAPDPMDFGLVAAGDLPATDTFAISNTGDPGTSLDITGLVLSGASQFSILAQTCSGATLNDGDSCSVTIEFDSVSNGMFMGQLEVQSTIGSETAAIQGSTQIPAQLAFTVQPADTIVNQAIVPSLVVEVQDSSGTLVGLDNSTVVEITLGADPSGSANLGGSLSATVSGGQATFAGLTIDQVGTGFTLIASDSLSALTPDTSALFDVLPGAPAALEIIAQPSDAGVGQAISPAVLVRVVDAFGFTVTSDNSTSISLALSGGEPGALLSGAGPVTVSGGLASFAGLSVDQAGLAYQLTPSGSPGGLSGPSSVAFDITGAASNTSILSVDPAGSQVVGQVYTVSVEVIGFNPTGSVTVTDGSGASCDIVLPATSCELTSTTAGPRTLTANYPGDANNDASNDIASYTITQAAAVLTIDSLDPAAEQAVNTPYTVNVSVVGFSPSGTITVDDGEGANCLIVLPASSCDLTSSSVGPKSITASYPGDANNSGDSASAPYSIVAGAPASLEFSVQPADGTAGVALNAVEVRVLDAFGNLVVADSASSVALNLIGGNPAAILGGGTDQTVTGGVVTFSALTIDLVGVNYQLQATSTGLFGATSQSFEIFSGPAVALQYDVQPSTTLVNAPISPAVVVSVRDAFGNRVVSDNSTSVGLTLLAPPGAVLQNGAATTVVDGLATFPDLAINLSGAGYQLRAQDTLAALPLVDSALFNITESGSTTVIDSVTPAGAQTVGLAYTVDVTVTGQSPTGMVTVSDGNGASCQFMTPTQSSCSLTSIIAGAVTITASYEGDINNASSSDTAAYLINQATTATTITSVDPSSEQTVGLPYTVTVLVTGFNPSGVVDVSDGEGGSCQITLPQTSCSMTSITVGPRTLSADYLGDGNNTASSGTAAYTINAVESTTSILGIAPPTQQEVGLPYTVTVSVNGSSPTGSVTVDDGAGESCTIDLPATSCDLTSTSAGARTITATYPGDSINTPSSDSVAYTIIDSGPAALAFALEPSFGIAGGPLLQGLIVNVVNSQGGLVVGDNTTVIQLAIATNPSSGTLSGTTTLQVVNGVADFSDLSIDRVGDGYQIEASVLSRGLSAIVTAPFDVKVDQTFKDRFEAPTDDVFQDRFELE